MANNLTNTKNEVGFINFGAIDVNALIKMGIFKIRVFKKGKKGEIVLYNKKDSAINSAKVGLQETFEFMSKLQESEVFKEYYYSRDFTETSMPSNAFAIITHYIFELKEPDNTDVILETEVMDQWLH